MSEEFIDLTDIAETVEREDDFLNSLPDEEYDRQQLEEE
jgi:hypothetical protein